MESILKAQQGWYRDVWGLEHIPFYDFPPEDVERLWRFFLGRDAEMERALHALFRGDNILVRGAWGIGKTAFILVTLDRLQREAHELGTKVVAIHVKDFPGGTAREFQGVVLRCLEKGVGRGRLRKSARWKLGVNVQSATELLPVGGGIELEREPAAETTQPLDAIYELLERNRKAGSRIAIAIDDLDKVENQRQVQQMLRECLGLLRDQRCAFVLTGRAITLFEDLEVATLGIASEILPLPPLSEDELKEIVVRQLNTARPKSRDDPFPFTQDVLDEIARRSLGFPRTLNRLCLKVLQVAQRRQYKTVGAEEFEECYKELQSDISIQVPPEVKRILYFALQRGGIPITKDAPLDDLMTAVGVSTLTELVPYLNTLVRADLLTRDDRTGLPIYKLSPGAEQAAQEGALPKGGI
jgi:Cdc6-like AAA superfamily ATPase